MQCRHPPLGSKRIQQKVTKEGGESWEPLGFQMAVVQLLFVGTGTSEGIPLLSCLTSEDQVKCKVCLNAVEPQSKNFRRNTSLLVRVRTEKVNQVECKRKESRLRNILIDCGKFFWPSAMKLFPPNNIRFLDALLITHGHNDASYGIDDLRDWTMNVHGSLNISHTYVRQWSNSRLPSPM